jgi:cysteine desulfurase
VLISIMAANNEIGTLAPLTEIGAIAREHEVLFHTDATQSAGYVPIDVQKMKIDLLSLSAHKLYGPKGIGALYVRRSNPRVRLAPLFYGGGHERGMRSGTLNVPGIVGFGAAAELARREMAAEAARLRGLTELLFDGLRERIDGVERNGHPAERLPHNLNIYIPGIESRAFIAGLKELAIATGSACTSAAVEPSHVIMALGCGEQRAHGSLRFGLGRGNDQEQVAYAADTTGRRAEQLRKFL